MRLARFNRWQLISALVLAVPVAFVVWIQLTKVCGRAELGHMMCAWDETWRWIGSGGDWKLWTFLGLYIVCVAGALLDPNKDNTPGRIRRR